MDFVQWALDKAVEHPDLAGAIVTADGESLDVLLPDGRTFRFRPGVFIAEDAPEVERAELLYRLISIGVEQAKAAKFSGASGEHDNGTAGSTAASTADPDASSAAAMTSAPTPASGNDGRGRDGRDSGINGADGNGGGSASNGEAAAYMAADSRENPAGDVPGDIPTQAGELAPMWEEDPTIVPIVRAADYFVNSHRGDDSMVYVPLTDFVGVGLALDRPDVIQPIYYSQMEQVPSDVGSLLAESVNALRQLVGHQRLSVDLGLSRISGADVVTFLAPDNYELSWFCDVEMMIQVAQRLHERHPNDIPLFVPAARTKLYVVFSEDPHLVDFFKILLTQRRSPEAVYPLPHTVTADGWKEWVPFADSELAQVLGALRNSFRQEIYAQQVQALSSWTDCDFGELKSYTPRRMHSGQRVSATEWNAMDVRGSIPDTDFISFVREPSPHPWENPNGVRITIRSQVAREIWPQGIVRDPMAWPSRWNVQGFPDEATLGRLIESADREF
ncbi:MAG: hypothetical protein PUK59_07545 [Actinomycetaceae bacterium]|nr:hypothetical protein [Actinomycetaceae bacterium]MDY5854366.1 hypothetical protein [Arcanobacterium sp.]